MMTPQQLVAEAKAQIREVDSAAAAKLLNEGARCLDVRETGAHEAEHLPGGIEAWRSQALPMDCDTNRYGSV